MSRNVSLPLLLSLVAPALFAVTIPAGTELDVRLTVPVSSNQKSGAPVQAVLVVPVYLNNGPAIDSGAILTGNTADVQPFAAATETTPDQQAHLRLQFTKIAAPGARQTSLSCTLASIDNARETVDTTGLVIGIDQTQTFGAQMDRGITKLEQKYGSLGQLLGQVKNSIVKQVDPSIDFKAGVDLKVKLTRDLNWQASPAKAAIAAIASADELEKVVNAQPNRTAALQPPEPSDLTNIMFIGTLEQIQSAFDKAGWFSAAALSQESKMETARAIIENRGYNEAPMSVLTLDRRPPDLALQKQNDTFAMRHHIRVWQRPETFDGKPIWVAAATHDISITFSQASKSFTHGIDPNIDHERSKVVSDMLFTGTARAVALVDRPNIPADLSNATGDKLATDGKMAVIEF